MLEKVIKGEIFLNYPHDQAYISKWKSIVNVLTHQNLGVSRVAQAGSRARKKYRSDSDMDVIFAVSENPSRRTFYPILIGTLEDNFSNDSVYAGSNFNVVHIDFQNGAKFDLVLLTENDFDKQYKNIKRFRKNNL